MNTSADSRSNIAHDQLEAARQNTEPAADATLLELGKVSDTRGGFLGMKLDVGHGFMTF